MHAALSANMKRTRFNTDMEVAVKYGANVKDKKTKERVDLSYKAEHRDQGANKMFNFTVNMKLPATV